MFCAGSWSRHGMITSNKYIVRQRLCKNAGRHRNIFSAESVGFILDDGNRSLTTRFIPIAAISCSINMITLLQHKLLFNWHRQTYFHVCFPLRLTSTPTSIECVSISFFFFTIFCFNFFFFFFTHPLCHHCQSYIYYSYL